MLKMKFIVYFAAVLVAVSAHLCLINPEQRGTMDGLDKMGANDCLLLSGPCGGRPVGQPNTIWLTGEDYTVVFQKNLDHYNSSTPGYFSINLILSATQSRELQRVPDAGEPSLYIYTARGKLPTDVPLLGEYALQVQYVTRNSQAPPVFFQCADVLIIGV